MRVALGQITPRAGGGHPGRRGLCGRWPGRRAAGRRGGASRHRSPVAAGRAPGALEALRHAPQAAARSWTARHRRRSGPSSAPRYWARGGSWSWPSGSSSYWLAAAIALLWGGRTVGRRAGRRSGRRWGDRAGRRSALLAAATAATALGRDRVSRRLLTSGAPRVALDHGDLANPTSNPIYAEVGYRRVGDWEHRRFGNQSGRCLKPGPNLADISSDGGSRRRD